MTVIEQLYIQSLYIFISGLLFASTFIFNYHKKHALGRSYYVAVGGLLIIGLSLYAYSQALYTDTENILFAFMAISVLIFKGAARHYRFWTIFAIVIVLKFYRLEFMGVQPNFSFYILIQNTTILAVLMYFFLLYFYRALENSVQETKNSEKTLYNLIDNISIFIALFNADGTYKIVNRHYEKALKLKRRQIIGKSAHEVFDENIADWQNEIVEQAINKKESARTKKISTLKDGSPFVGYGRANPILDKHGNVIAVAGYIDNITELELVKQKLDQANESKDKVLSILTHDLRSPLNTFESILNSTQYQIITSDNFEEFIERLKNEFQPVKETINDLLYWAKSNMQDLHTNFTTFHCDKIIKEIIESSRLIASQKDIEIIVQGVDQQISMDLDHFKMALRNLIQNAIKFSNEGGVIKIKLAKKDKNISLSVQDSGIGISSDKIEEILRGEITKPGLGTAGEKGSGIGLSMVVALLQKNNCNLDIQSTEGKGSTFTLRWAI
ncbi:sensor histidine kinase [Marivirga tractuosa]|uniref:sensor histidine kinase n=1 Tax=Marivirga tractuosa TaxID=1006 RepID=UPI0016106B1F|nr:PAS domain-containing sensor histidine kinase [Marivirga tractuosa]